MTTACLTMGYLLYLGGAIAHSLVITRGHASMVLNAMDVDSTLLISTSVTTLTTLTDKQVESHFQRLWVNGVSDGLDVQCMYAFFVTFVVLLTKKNNYIHWEFCDLQLTSVNADYEMQMLYTHKN